MLKPAYKLTIGQKANNTAGALGSIGGASSGLISGQVIDTTAEPQASTVVDLTVTLDMDAPADSFTMITGQVGAFRLSRANEITIELGYADDELTQVMVGGIVSVTPGLLTSRAVGHSAAEVLLHTFVDQTYESKTAGQIVRDLAGQAQVEVATAEDGITFPAYVIDGRRNFYRHMRDLAHLCGFDVYIDAENKLVFKKFTNGNTLHSLEYAKHIIELDVAQTVPFAGQVEAWGESKGAGQGDESWAWLTKDFSGSKGSAGSGAPKQLLERPALRTAGAARTAAEAANTRHQRRGVRGQILIAGRPQVKLGDAIRLQAVPDDGLNNTYQVRSVIHRLTKQKGFTTTIGFRSIAN